MQNNLTTRQRELLAFLGNDYTAKVIDQSESIYRDLGDYDIEVIGGCTRRNKFHVFLWQRKPNVEIIERFLDLPHDFAIVKGLTDDMSRRYCGRKGVSV